jgi:hypothetical protein
LVPRTVHRHHVGVPGEDIELASKTAGEIASQVAEVLVDKSGVLEPLRELVRLTLATADALVYPRLIRLCQNAAARIEESGLPRQAVGTLPPRLRRSHHWPIWGSYGGAVVKGQR